MLYVWNIEQYMMKNSNGKYQMIHYRGLAPSRLENVNVGSGEFRDLEVGMIWPGGYAPYYIGKKNVMPTKAFYEYIMYRTKHPFPGMKWEEVKRPTYPACPPDKVYNHDTRRCVAKSGKIGKLVLKEQQDIAKLHPIWPAYILRYGINYEEKAKKYKRKS